VAKLVVLLSDGSTRDVLLRKDRITLGRRPDNDVCLPHPAVSGEHAAVVTILSDSFLEDLSSTNGTFVNGQPIQKHFLRDGDTIELGRQRLVFLVDEGAHPPGLTPAQRSAAAADAVHWDKPSTMPGMARAVSPRSRADDDDVTPADPVTISEAPPVMPPALPELLVLTGPSAGRTLALTKEVTSVGRVGVQIALVRRTAYGYVLVPGDGSPAPLVNGTVVPDDGAVLSSGDVIDVAGARIEFVAATDLPL
jgi:predicted component of type VI protein secretion system